jgi:repressor LexA
MKNVPKTPLEFWRKARKLSRQRLADLVDCHMQTIRKLEDGTMTVDKEWSEKIAPYLHVIPSELLPIAINPKGGHGMRLVPVVAWASAGEPMESLAQHIDETTERVAVSHSSLTLLSVKVVGNSMNLIAEDGEIAVYDYTDKELVDKKYYLFMLNGEVCFKRYRDSGGPKRFEPQSDQPHDTHFPRSEIEVIGRVIQIIRTL